MMSKKHLHFHIPEEIIVNILCRLPVKSLNRFRCVSKLWHSIISDPEFAKSHFELACKQGILSQRFLTTRLLISDISSYPVQSIHPEAALFGDISSVRNLTFPTHESKQQPERIFLLGSCNGLVFVSLDGYNNLCIWNPSNRFVQKLPSPDFMTCACENLKRISVFFMHGLGYVSATDDYKLFAAAQLHPDIEYENDVVMEMFSLKANSWRSIEYPEDLVDPEPETFYSAIQNHLGALTNEALHWVYCSDDNEPFILAFDLAREEFRLMPLPLPFSEEDDDTDDGYVNFQSMGIQVLSGGCLSVSFLRMDCIEFWVMIEYEMFESWTKLFEFSIDDLPVSYYWHFNGKEWWLYGKEPIFVTESGTVLLVCGAEGEDKELIRIECNKEEFVCSDLYSLEKMPGIAYDVIQYVMQYDETLLTLPLIK